MPTSHQTLRCLRSWRLSTQSSNRIRTNCEMPLRLGLQKKLDRTCVNSNRPMNAGRLIALDTDQPGMKSGYQCRPCYNTSGEYHATLSYLRSSLPLGNHCQSCGVHVDEFWDKQLHRVYSRNMMVCTRKISCFRKNGRFNPIPKRAAGMKNI